MRAYIYSLIGKGLEWRRKEAQLKVKPLLDKNHAVKVRLDYSDGSFREITGEEAYKWNEKILMLNYLDISQLKFDEIKWEKGKIDDSKI